VYSLQEQNPTGPAKDLRIGAMRIRIDYGKSGLELELPDQPAPTIISPTYTPPVEDRSQAVCEALKLPIGSTRLSERIGPADRVAIVFSDITRPTPYNVMVPPLLEEIQSAGVPDRNIIFFNATGTHRPNTHEELTTILGKDVVERFRIVQNDCTDDTSHRHIGTTTGGNEIEILSEFLDCDVRIPTGFIEPHFFAGMSGGGKAIMPGLAGLRTIQRNHSAAHMDHPKVRWGITEGNPLWEEVREAALLAEPSFILNVALNRNKDITAVFAGDFAEAHRAGCSYVKERAMAPVEEAFDIVITSNSGYPLDLNLYQSVKGMSAASQIVRDGGHIIMAADCWDGIPAHGQYGQLLAASDSTKNLLAQIRAPGFAAADMWQAQIHALVCEQATVHFYTENLSDEQLQSAFLKPCHDVGRRVHELVGELGMDARICVIPEGPQTIPYIKGSG
jgi:nickel-dependent lactate racemase